MVSTGFKLSRDWSGVPFYCGIDVHKHQLTAAIFAKDRAGFAYRKTEPFPSDPAGLEHLWGFVAKYRPVGFAMEATGVYHHTVVQFLENKRPGAPWEFSITVTNPADAAALPGRKKYDRVDAEWLARYLAAGLLGNSRPIVTALEDLRAVFRGAARLQSHRTAIKNRIKKTLDRAGFRPTKFNLNMDWARDFLFGLTNHPGTVGEFLERVSREEGLLSPHKGKIRERRPRFTPYLSVKLSIGQKALIRQDVVELELKTARRALLTVEIDKILSFHPGLQQLVANVASIPGFSPFSATWLLAEVGNVRRYPTVRQFLRYCGLCSRVKSSAGKTISAHLDKHANGAVRVLFVKAAMVVCNHLKKDSALLRYARRVLARKGRSARMLAYCIVAAKLARITYAITRDNTRFVPMLDSGGDKARVRTTGVEITIADRKTLRQARNCLKRVEHLQHLELVASKAKVFAEALEDVLKEI